MRISTLQIANNMQYQMASTASSINDNMTRLSSGKQLLKPSDDPLSSLQTMALKDQNASLSGYQKNIQATRNRLDMTETQLGDMNTTLDRARELVMAIGSSPARAENSNNSKKTETTADADADADAEDSTDSTSKTDGESGRRIGDIQARAQEIKSLVQELAGLANSRSATGEYIFAGSWGDQPAAHQEGGQYHILTPDSPREVQISDSRSVPAGELAGTVLGQNDSSILNQLNAFAELASNPDTDQEELDIAINTTLDAIDQAQARVNEALTRVGASLNALDTAENSMTDRQTYNETLQKGLEDVNITRTTMDLNMEMQQFETSKKAYAMMNRATLFDYM